MRKEEEEAGKEGRSKGGIEKDIKRNPRCSLTRPVASLTQPGTAYPQSQLLPSWVWPTPSPGSHECQWVLWSSPNLPGPRPNPHNCFRVACLGLPRAWALAFHSRSCGLVEEFPKFSYQVYSQPLIFHGPVGAVTLFGIVCP